MLDVCKKFFYVAWLTVLSFLILFCVVFFAPLVFLISKEFFPNIFNPLMIMGPSSFTSWAVVFALSLSLVLPVIALAVWTARDANRLKKRRMKIRPFFWLAGVILPTAVIVFPVYFVLRRTVWLSEAELENNKVKKGGKTMRVAVVVMLAILAVGFLFKTFYKIGVREIENQVEKIHNTKLTLDDVMGKNLPPDPGAEADKTVAGVDANQNGIRDDVELAIFKTYPDSAKTRAALLQYALALQMEATVKVVNKETVVAAVQEEDRAYLCVGEILSRNDMEKYDKESEKLRSFIKEKQLNTTKRRKTRTDFYEKIGSYNSLPRICDIDYSLFPN